MLVVVTLEIYVHNMHESVVATLLQCNYASGVGIGNDGVFSFYLFFPPKTNRCCTLIYHLT